MQVDTSAWVPGRSMPDAHLRSSAVTNTHGTPSAVPPRGVWEALTVLIEALNCVLVDDDADAREYVLSAFELLQQSSGRPSKGSLTDQPPPWSGGLAGWQARRLSLHIDQHLGETLLCKDLARLVNLSISHFIRAFKASFGCSPHAYVIRRRMELAQGLMLTTAAPLRQIALDCGFADQAHLSRLFKQMVGASPAAWRRARSQPSGMLATRAAKSGDFCANPHALTAALPPSRAPQRPGLEARRAW